MANGMALTSNAQHPQGPPAVANMTNMILLKSLKPYRYFIMIYAHIGYIISHYCGHIINF